MLNVEVVYLNACRDALNGEGLRLLGENEKTTHLAILRPSWDATMPNREEFTELILGMASLQELVVDGKLHTLLDQESIAEQRPDLVVSVVDEMDDLRYMIEGLWQTPVDPLRDEPALEMKEQ